jgi:hypothetical protein
MGTRPGHVDVRNRERDTKTLRVVFKTDDGRPPAKGEDGTTPQVESYQLILGSADDDTDEIREHNAACKRDGKIKDMVIMPVQSVPSWALAHYRALPLFKTWEDSLQIVVTRAA